MNPPGPAASRTDLARIIALAGLIAPHARQLAFGVALFLVARGASLLIPLVSAPIIDRIIPAADRPGLDRAIVLIIALSFAALVASLAKDLLVSRVTNALVVEVRGRLQGVLQSVPIETQQRWRPGYWMARIDGDVQSLSILSGETTIALIEDLVSIVLASALIVYTSAKMSVLLLFFAPFLVLSAVVLSRRITSAAHRNRERWGTYMTFLEEEIRNSLLVKALGVEQRRATRGNRLLRAAGRADLQLIMKNRLIAALTSVAGLFLPVAVLWFGMRAVMQGQLSLGLFIAFNTYVGYVTAPINRIVALVRNFRVSAVSFDRIADVLALPTEDARATTTIDAFRDRIELQQIDFTYEDGRRALTRVSATIPAGRHVALVGPNGSGKSTLLRVIQGYYEPAAGRLSIDGVDASTLRRASLRGLFGYVPATGSLLLDGTLRENLTFGAQDRRELPEILAELQFFEGTGLTEADLERRVSDVGARLSEGQRQLVALVRMLLRKPQIAVIDEGMTFLDGVNAQRVVSVLRRRLADTTVLWATHLYDQIEDFDSVMVLNRGRVESFGSLGEVVAGSPWFRGVYEREGRREGAHVA